MLCFSSHANKNGILHRSLKWNVTHVCSFAAYDVNSMWIEKWILPESLKYEPLRNFIK